MSKQPPPAPTASAVGPCPTVIQIVGRPGTGSLPSTIAPPDHPLLVKRFQLNIFEILQGEGPAPPVGNRDLPFVMTAIAACRLGVIFGSTLDPESITRDTTQRMGFKEGSLDARVEARKEEERFALLPGDNDRIDEGRRMDGTMGKEIV